MTALETVAREYGTRDGTGAASWVEWDGPQAAAEWLEKVADGDPEIMTYGPSPLSGEWAGDPTWPEIRADIYRGADVDLPDDPTTDDRDSELADTYLDSYSDAWWDRANRDAAHLAADYTIVGPAEFPAGSIVTYATTRGEAWRVLGWWEDDSSTDSVAAVMVGDDRAHCLPVATLAPLDELDYCAECGQVGCTGDFRDRD